MTEEKVEKPLLERMPDGSYMLHKEGTVRLIDKQIIMSAFLKELAGKHQPSYGLLTAWLNKYYRLTAETEMWFKKQRLLENFEFYMRLGKEKLKRGEKLINNNWG